MELKLKASAFNKPLYLPLIVPYGIETFEAILKGRKEFIL